MAIASIGWLDRLRSVRLDPTVARLVVLGVGLIVFAVKVWVAVHTYGTNDVETFMGFAQGVRQRGPVGIYSIDYHAGPHRWVYNHPPLMGYFLYFMNWLSAHGIPLRVTLRSVASAADVLSGLLIYEILRRRAPIFRATLCGVAVAASPLLFLISGFHGNTDTIFLALVLLGSFLIVDASLPLWGGIALALGLGIKIVAVVVLPTLAIYLLLHRRKDLLTAAAGFTATLAVTWGPALVREWTPVRHNVLGYAGIGNRTWGIVRFANDAGWPALSDFLTGPGGRVIVLMCALIPALLVWRARDKAIEGVALSLVATLVFLPGYAIQYLSWAVAAAYLLAPFPAMLYNLLAGLMVFQAYEHWNGGDWTKLARARVITPHALGLLALVWAILVTVLSAGTRRMIATQVERMPP